MRVHGQDLLAHACPHAHPTNLPPHRIHTSQLSCGRICMGITCQQHAHVTRASHAPLLCPHPPPLQMTYNSSLLPHLRDAAMEALRGMDRKPITDPMSVA